MFVRALYDALKPGGRVLIYNICPAPSPPGQPYKKWADGRCPFARETWEAAGFRVVAFDRDDSEVIRQFAHALGWDQGDSPIDLKADLFARYSLMEKLARPADSNAQVSPLNATERTPCVRRPDAVSRMDERVRDRQAARNPETAARGFMSLFTILSIDGGGIRGIIPAMVLADIERRTGRRIADFST